MESMEEGYLAKIIHGDGAKEIKVGEVRISWCEGGIFYDDMILIYFNSFFI